MNIAQMSCSQLPNAAALATIARMDPQLVLCFGPARYLTDPRLLAAMREVVPSLALLVSCVGRKLVMGARVDDEVDVVVEVLGKHTRVAGFYSYGELCPQRSGQACQLHNQTMTITHIQERPAL